MSPDSKGEMNHEATGEEEEEESVPSAERNSGEHLPHVCHVQCKEGADIHIM